MSKRKRAEGDTEEQRKERKRIKKEQKKQKRREEKEARKKTTRHVDVDDKSFNATGEEVFFRQKLELTISLLPSTLGSVRASIEDALRLILLKYTDGIGGILLAFENVEILSDNKSNVVGMIINELPHIHYRVATDALIFCPVPGCKTSGSVMDSSFHSHLSLVVHHYFNASVSADQLREAGFEFDGDQLQWYWQNSANTLSKGDCVDFVCQKMYESGGIISIEGTNPILRAKEV